MKATMRWANDSELVRLLDRAGPVSSDEHEQWFAGLNGRSETELHFAIETDDGEQHVGNIWLRNIDARHRKAEVSVVIGESDSLSKGIGTEAIRLLADHAFQVLELNRLYAHVLGFNIRAKTAFERSGFELEGILRSDRRTLDGFTDVFLLSRLA